MKAKQMLLGVVLLAGLASTAWGTDPEGIEVTRFLPEFQTQKTVKRLEEGLAPAKDLDSKLKTSTERIWQLIEAYRQSPSAELENQIYHAVAETGEMIVESINDLEGHRDRLRDELHQLNFNVDGVIGNLKTYTTSLDARVGDIVEEAKNLKEQLTGLAQHLVNNPDDEKKREEFRQGILALKRLRLKLGLYERNKAMYDKLAAQIGKVSGFFAEFETRLDAVLDSLALQKRLVAMNLTVLRDKAKIAAWLRGEADGQSGVAGMMKQLADLSGTVQSFDKVMDVMMNLGGDFDNFAEIVPELADPSLPESTSVTEEQLDDLIRKFSQGE